MPLGNQDRLRVPVDWRHSAGCEPALRARRLFHEKDNHLTNFDPTTVSMIAATDNGIAGRAITYGPAASLQVSGIQQDFRGANNYRPNVIGNRLLPGGGPQNGLPYLNAASFQIPAGTPFGNAGRNIARGPNFNQLDFAANKSFQLPFESMRMQFRVEFFNLLNHTNFLPPNSNFSSAAAFGKITQAFDARQVQFGLKLSF